MTGPLIIQFNAKQLTAFAGPVRRASFENWLNERAEIGDLVTRSKTDDSVLVEDQKGNSTKLSNDFKTTTILAKNGEKLVVQASDRNQITSITNADNLQVSFGYDEGSKINSITRGEFGSYQFDYGTDGDIAKISFPDGAQSIWENDVSGQSRKILDRNGNATILHMDGEKRVTNVVDRNGYQTNLHYDEWDQPDKIEFPNGDKHEYIYSDAGRLKSLIVNGNKFANYDSDDAGWVHASYRHGGEVHLQAQDGRILQGHNAAGQIEFARDADGRLLGESNPFAKTAFERDDVGRLIQQTTNRGPDSLYEYDDFNRVTSVSAWDTKIDLSYHKNGSLAAIHWPNGVSKLQSSDKLGRPMDIRLSKGGADLRAWNFQYDACDRVTQEAGASGVFEYEYDREGRLTKAQNTTKKTAENFELDPSGNCISGPFGSADYNELNQIRNAGGQQYQHDLMGNVIQAGSSRFKFTANNKLERALVNGQEIQFTYDAAGRRLTKKTSNSLTQYVWAGQQLVAEKTTGRGKTELREYLWLPERPVPVAMKFNGDIYALHTGRRNEVLMMTDNSGDVVWEAEYSAFGEASITISKVAQPWRFAGHYHDLETDLHYCSARYYDPKVGRYLSQDPLFLEGGNSNFYIYCGGDPLNFIDPTGEFIFTAIIVGAVIGAAIGAGIEYYRQSKAGGPIDKSEVFKAGLIGGTIGAVGGAVGAVAATTVGGLIGATATVTMGQGAIMGFAGGVAGSLAEQCPDALLNGTRKSKMDIFKEALIDGVIGAGIGAVTAGTGGFIAKRLRKGGKDIAEEIFEGSVKKVKNPRTRLPRTRGKWKGEPGNGEWFSDKPEVKKITKGNPVVFKDGRPDFSPWSKGELTFKKGKLNGTDDDFDLVYEEVMKKKKLKSKNAARLYLKEMGLTPHHKSNTEIELIPSKLHNNIPHIGSASDMRGGG